MKLRYGSVCSGIEAASVAWKPLGWDCAFVSEIDKPASALLAHHYTDVPNFGDMTQFKDWPDEPIDILVGGTPCQSFSIAGMRRGLDDPRGSLMLTFGAIARRYRPTWILWENVPGVLSSNGGRDFGAFLGMLGECGYGFAYRTLDAQYFGLAQRRKRVFVVGYLGDWRPAAAVFLERHCLRGDSSPRRQAGKAAPTIPSRSTAGGGLGTDFDLDGGLIARCVTAGEGSRQDWETTTMVTHSLRGEGFDASEDGTGRGTPIIVHGTQDPCIGDIAFALGRNNGGENAIAFSCKDHGADAGDLAPTLRAMGHDGSHANAGGQVAISHETAVRRLTPRECERLMGFPDDYTAVPNGKGVMADGPRYKMLGNSMAVPCMRWIGERIEATRAIAATQQEGER